MFMSESRKNPDQTEVKYFDLNQRFFKTIHRLDILTLRDDILLKAL